MSLVSGSPIPYGAVFGFDGDAEGQRSERRTLNRPTTGKNNN